MAFFFEATVGHPGCGQPAHPGRLQDRASIRGESTPAQYDIAPMEVPFRTDHSSQTLGLWTDKLAVGCRSGVDSGPASARTDSHRDHGPRDRNDVPLSLGQPPRVGPDPLAFVVAPRAGAGAALDTIGRVAGLIEVDGHEINASFKRHCPGCLERTIHTKRGDRIQYYHRVFASMAPSAGREGTVLRECWDAEGFRACPQVGRPVRSSTPARLVASADSSTSKSTRRRANGIG